MVWSVRYRIHNNWSSDHSRSKWIDIETVKSRRTSGLGKGTNQSQSHNT